MSRHAAMIVKAHALLEQGDVPGALAAAQRAAGFAPLDPEALLLVASIQLRQGRLAPAAYAAERAASLGGNPALRLQAIEVMRACRESGRALHFLDAMAAEHPNEPSVHGSLAAVLMDQRRFTEAEGRLRAALARLPGDGSIVTALAGACLNLARPEEAVDLVRELASGHPTPPVLSGLCMLSNYDPRLGAAEVAGIHRSYGASWGASPPPLHGAFSPPGPGERIRVGIVSPDLRRHSVAWFIEPLLKHLDRDAFDLVVYQTNAIADDVTARLRALVPAWRVLDRHSDDEVAARIAADGVRVLLELSGHTHANCLGALRLRPAPVQITYLGYPNTTGMREVGFRIVDSVTDPPGVSDTLATERLLRLDPCFLCYDPPEDSPPVAPRVAGPFSFGSFNSAQKLNARVIALWSRVLAACPGARLVLKAVNFADAPLREHVLARFASAGVSPDRVRVDPPHDATRDHLGAYAQIDAALDPIPYNGTTTTCEALWMGVPVVTLAGSMHAGRVGASLLHAIGLPEFIASSESEYVEACVAAFRDPARLAGVRAGLRERVRQSPLCDAPGLCRGFERAIREACSPPR